MQIITYSDDPYVGYNNTEVDLLKQQLNLLEHKKVQVTARLEELQVNCNHEYKFSCSGMYEDSYVCCLCGHEA